MDKYYYLLLNDDIQSVYKLDVGNNSITEVYVKTEEIIVSSVLDIQKAIHKLYFGDTEYSFTDFVKSHKIVESKLNPGDCYNSIYRPIYPSSIHISTRKCNDCPIEHKDAKDINTSLPEIDLRLFLNDFELLFNSIEVTFSQIFPVKANGSVYGNGLVNILILCCTSIEAHIKNVLRKNGYKVSTRSSTKDYVKILAPTHVNEYTLSFRKYPDLKDISPFSSWDENEPTKSLIWYDAYNSLKHDKFKNYSNATLDMALQAFIGLAIIYYSQYQSIPIIKNLIESNFVINKKPRWKYNEYYLRPLKNDTWNIIELFAYELPRT